MKVLTIYLVFILTFLGASLFNDHPNKNFKSNLELKNQTIQTLLNDI